METIGFDLDGPGHRRASARQRARRTPDWPFGGGPAFVLAALFSCSSDVTVVAGQAQPPPLPTPPRCAPSDPPIRVAPYVCRCPDGETVCQLMPGCCTDPPNEVYECGDILPKTCANHRCLAKAPPGRCWSDTDCIEGACGDARICGCGDTFAEPDRMGWCQPPS
jgi:hypothetical protein